MKRILISILTIGLVGGAGFAVTRAFFSDTEVSAGNTFTAGELDLKIDNTSYLNGQAYLGSTWALADLDDNNGPAAGKYLFFNFNDLKPDDEGEDTISLHVANDAYACMSIAKTEDDDETCTEPELADDPTCNEEDTDLLDGELGGLLNFIFWNDDGDNVLEDNETVFKQGTAASLFDGTTWTLADSASNIWTGVAGPIPAGQTYNIGKSWCFGTLTPNPVAAGQGVSPIIGSGVNCDGTVLNNASQTDKFMANIEFTAVQSRSNPNFLCTPTIACEEVWADSVEANDQGTRKDSTPVLASRSDATKALVAQTLGNVYDSPVVEGTFYSLGFKIGNAEGGSIVVEFNNPIYPVAGANNDIQIFEVTGGTVYPDETVKVEASQNAGGPWTLLSSAAIRDEALDISPLPSAKFIRITDVSNINDYESIADAYDLDGVKAFCGSNTD